MEHEGRRQKHESHRELTEPQAETECFRTASTLYWTFPRAQKTNFKPRQARKDYRIWAAFSIVFDGDTQSHKFPGPDGIDQSFWRKFTYLFVNLFWSCLIHASKSVNMPKFGGTLRSLSAQAKPFWLHCCKSLPTYRTFVGFRKDFWEDYQPAIKSFCDKRGMVSFWTVWLLTVSCSSECCFGLGETVNSVWRSNKVLTAVAYDLEGAYDNVDRYLPYSELKNHQCAANLINFVGTFWTDELYIPRRQSAKWSVLCPKRSTTRFAALTTFVCHLHKPATEANCGNPGRHDQSFCSWCTGFHYLKA